MLKNNIIGRGMTAEVYEWDDSKVLKLYYEGFSEDIIKFEANIGKQIFEAGISSPEVYGIVEVEGRLGIVFQRIHGQSMLKLIEKKPWKLAYYSRCMARMHAEMHLRSAGGLPDQKDNLVASIAESSNLLAGKENVIINYLNNLSNGTSVCHGDFHPDNIIVADGELTAIDWINVSSGNPFADVARTCLMIGSPAMPPGSSMLSVIISKLAKKLICSFYLKEYIKCTKSRYEVIDEWFLPVAAARLREKIPGEEKWIMKIIDERLKRL
ncbi:MAG TPA: aminoglycoside phosphotransferase family protein [Spirochaetota bacterium]|jgi:uncharacterized protein (TIGR02172 family)|nr:aminoglycoside phosphotransferase family protein [Spirochaetota bacterium]HOH37033.1 aminoglycoside phosphotransferase family protein [Spirochaetota bacterium]HPJ15410.1 aminoglycoside phosphotransferase family protein [Spirochaetota bacterium]HPM34711.1 aminoglycoside phosphotransferase family protein [Spirochaetota bacterium]HPY02694.1 aminoglycoside phosphotransferase family protein [Spirochaetota bacterium]